MDFGSISNSHGTSPLARPRYRQVTIYPTPHAMPAYTEQDFLNALNEVKVTIPGLYNVSFTASGVTIQVPQHFFDISTN